MIRPGLQVVQPLVHTAAHGAFLMLLVLVVLASCQPVVVIVVLLMMLVYIGADADASGRTVVGAPPTNGHRQVTPGGRGEKSMYGGIGALRRRGEMVTPGVCGERTLCRSIGIHRWRHGEMVVKTGVLVVVVGIPASQRPAFVIFDSGGGRFRARKVLLSVRHV